MDKFDPDKYGKSHAGLPERFYTESQLSVTTPDNCERFVEHITKHDIKEVDFQEHRSWSSTLTSWGFRSNHIVAFPTDLRHGWDLRRPEHQQLITSFRKK
eukprot:8424438-Pyramimonas_sp.AAC.1